MVSGKICVAMICITVFLITIIYLLFVYNTSQDNSLDTPNSSTSIKDIDYYYNQDVHFVFIYNSTNNNTHIRKCVELKCQNACDYHHQVKDAIAPLSICINKYNYCQCLRYTEFLNIKCEKYDCNVNCVGSGHDYGICDYNNNGCYCFDTLNFRDGLTKTRWEKIIEYHLINTNLKVRLVDLINH